MPDRARGPTCCRRGRRRRSGCSAGHRTAAPPRAAAGHDDWPGYRESMQRERRVLISIDALRAGTRPRGLSGCAGVARRIRYPGEKSSAGGNRTPARSRTLRGCEVGHPQFTDGRRRADLRPRHLAVVGVDPGRGRRSSPSESRSCWRSRCSGAASPGFSPPAVDCLRPDSPSVLGGPDVLSHVREPRYEEEK